MCSSLVNLAIETAQKRQITGNYLIKIPFHGNTQKQWLSKPNDLQFFISPSSKNRFFSKLNAILFFDLKFIVRPKIVDMCYIINEFKNRFPKVLSIEREPLCIYRYIVMFK